MEIKVWRTEYNKKSPSLSFVDILSFYWLGTRASLDILQKKTIQNLKSVNNIK